MIETANPAPTRIQKAVMRRVRIIRTIRPFVSNFAGALYLLTLSLYMLGREVFVAQVFSNMSNVYDFAAAMRFLESAFLNTTMTVQVVSLAAGAAALWIAFETIKVLIPSHQRFA